MGKTNVFSVEVITFLIDLLQNPIALINTFLLWNMILIFDYHLYSADLECFRK